MKTKLTYLLGAGASANSLPTVNNLLDRLQNFMFYLQKKTSNNDFENILGEGFDKILDVHKINAKRLIDDLNWLLSEARKHKTIDTLAKKYFLIENYHSNLLRLKKVLITFFLYEQTRYPYSGGNSIENEKKREKIDMRYDSFIASMLGNDINNFELPDNLKIITWNYDIQFELALKEYYYNLKIKEIQEKIQAYPSSKLLNEKDIWNPNKFSIVRLNGVAGIGMFNEFSEAKNPTFFDGIIEKNDGCSLNDILYYYQELNNNGNPSSGLNDLNCFNFSWEETEKFKQNIHPHYRKCKDIALEIMEETEVLIIIGYSFPFFNRDYDKELLSKAKKLKKIYVQDDNSEQILDLLISMHDNIHSVDEIRKSPELQYNNVIAATYVKNCSQFLIPYELV